VDRARGLGHLSEDEVNAIQTIWKKWNGYAGLEKSTVPILEIWGDRSSVRPDMEALQIPERPNIEIGWVRDASHSVLLEDPAQVARLVTRFMAEV
jgi:pimeloyl-ACP methyl ester carboxylesterase